MGCGQVVRRLILAQEIVGSNPTTPAIQRIGTFVPVFYIFVPRFESNERSGGFGEARSRAKACFEHD